MQDGVELDELVGGGGTKGVRIFAKEVTDFVCGLGPGDHNPAGGWVIWPRHQEHSLLIAAFQKFAMVAADGIHDLCGRGIGDQDDEMFHSGVLDSLEVLSWVKYTHCMSFDHLSDPLAEKYPLVPACETRQEILVVNSRFIAAIAPAFSVEEARGFIVAIRADYPDASHHVPAFIIGHGASLTEHCSDDGEPSGTAGRPAMAVLKGSGLGDAVVVVTRYFGGTKLGTGGLVRAYTDAVKAVLADLPLAVKAPTNTVQCDLPYHYYERIKQLAARCHGQVIEEIFAAEVSLTWRFLKEELNQFQAGLMEMTNGSVQAEVIGENLATIIPLSETA